MNDILIIGASGFIGSALLNYFEKQNVPVTVIARSPERVFTQSPETCVIKGDLEDIESLKEAVARAKTIYYLAHSMSDDGDFTQREKAQASNMASLLTEQHKIIYLGGIIPNMELSDHLRSRELVGDIFRETKARVIEFRASIIIGTGSASYEMIRALVNRLPFLVTAKWAISECQPIALSDVLTYLNLAHTKEFNENQIFNIGGPDILPYKDLLVRYAEYKKLRRPEIYIEDFPLNLAKEIMKIIIPEYAQISGYLIGSINLETIVTDSNARETFELETKDLEVAFKEASKDILKEIPLKTILSKLKDHKELPQYFKGQSLQFNFKVPENFNFEQIIDFIKDILPGKASGKKENIEFKLPFIGEVKVSYFAKESEVVILYKPKYFFQSMGWIIIQELIKKLEGKL